MEKLHKNILKECPLFRNISSQDFDRILNIAYANSYNYRKGDTVIGYADSTSRFGVVIKGKIIEVKYHYDGSSQILRLYGKRDIIGLNTAASMGTGSPGTFIADTECTVIFLWYRNIVDSDYLSGNCKSAVLRSIAKILAEENISSMHAIDILSHYTIRDRVMAFLITQQESKKTSTFDISMNQVQLAQYLRVNRSVLSKELNTMKREGIIDFKGSVYTLLTQ